MSTYINITRIKIMFVNQTVLMNRVEKGRCSMTVVVQFPNQETKKNNKKLNYLEENHFGIFDVLSKRTGVDMNKAVFEKDQKTINQMNRNLLKETFKTHTMSLT